MAGHFAFHQLSSLGGYDANFTFVQEHIEEWQGYMMFNADQLYYVHKTNFLMGPRVILGY